MRWLLGILFILCLSAFGAYVFLRGYPFRVYSDWIHGEKWNRYYTIDNYRPELLTPSAPEEIPTYKEDYGQLWREFSLRNTQIPLPVRHPLFQTIPFLESKGPKTNPQVGIILLNPNGREIIRIYTLPTSFEKDYSQGQELFKLPFVRNRLLKRPKDQLWRDVFSYKIEPKSKPINDMIYDLYILHMRAKMLPAGAVKYRLLNDNKALVEFISKDKDYTVELILYYSSGNIYSYILRTEINNDDSVKLRSKFLESITFAPVDTAISKFLYTEFKQLNFARQVDQEGMLYLLSAWTQDIDNTDLLKEMIFYLERGRNPLIQLKPLYAFALKHYGKTFTTRRIFGQSDDQDILLQRKIEIENIDKAREAQREKEKPPLEPELTPEERMNLYLKKAKESGGMEKDEMTIH